MTGRTVRSVLRLVLGTLLVAGVLAQAGAAQAAATITVNTFADEYTEGTDCSLREAITAVGSNGDFGGCDQTGDYGDDTILLPPGTYTLTRNGTEDQSEKDLDLLASGGDLTIQSMGGTAQNTIIQAGLTTGTGIDRVFHIPTAGHTVTLRDLTVRHGNDPLGDGGGAILHDGSLLNLERVAVRDSFTTAGNGGGGIWSSGTLNLSQVEISGNEASGSSGGGVYVFDGGVFGGSVTVSGNRTTLNGGGMHFEDGFSGLAGFTVANNTANSDNFGSNAGGGVYQTGGTTTDVYFAGSIIADNNVGTGGVDPDCSGDFNNPLATGVVANVVENGSGCSGFAGDVGLDPQLQALGLNSPGATQTHAIPSSSPAVDRWPTADCQSTTTKFPEQFLDQRGVNRPQGSACDSGAFELESSVATVPGVCKGKTATITGTQENDVLAGTGGNDIIAALGGNDTVNGAGKNDLICGGDGNDKLKGGSGKDKLLGENGNDKLKGGGGNDKMVGAKGKDTCSGGGGDKDRARKCEKDPGVP